MSLYSELWDRMGELGKDVGKLYQMITKATIAATGDETSLYRTGRDGNGIFTVNTYRRRNGSTAKTSELSIPDGNSRYTRRTETYYADDGTTVVQVRVYTISYNGNGEMVSEVLT